MWARWSGWQTPEQHAEVDQRFYLTTAPEDVPPADRSCGPAAVSVATRRTRPARPQIHFSNRDSADDVGPLSRAKTPRRLAELKTMFGFIRETWPEAISVQGGSWLYNLEAYRLRLLPAA